MKELKKNPRALMAIGGLVFLIFILILITLANLTPNIKNSEGENKGPSIIKSNTSVVEIEDITLEQDIKIQDTLMEYVNSGESGLYTIGDRSFVVLTTGDKSYGDIEYSLETTADGNDYISWWVSEVKDESYKLRYKILEVDNQALEVKKKSTPFDESKLDGFCEVLVYKDGDNNSIYSIRHNQKLSKNTIEVPGIYMADFRNGELNKLNKINYVTIDNCTVISREEQESSRIYNIDINGMTLEVYIDSLNIDDGHTGSLKLSYDSSKSTFVGEFI